MTDERVDLRPLDPTGDRGHHERAIGKIMHAAALPLARRRARLTAIGQVTRWWRPMLAMAAAVVLAAVGVLTQVDPTTTTAPPTTTVAEAMGIPTAVESWMTGGQTPTALEALGGFEVDQ